MVCPVESSAFDPIAGLEDYADAIIRNLYSSCSYNRLKAPLVKGKHKAALTAAPSLGIAETFSNLKKQGKLAFIPYSTAGDPDLSTTAKALKVLDSCGSDIIELGVPSSDPLADGPVIQAAASRSLARGTNFDAITSMLKELSCPVALFTSCNPILKLGIDKFMSTVKDNGVHGLVVPDVPIEETTLMRDVALKKNIELVLLTTPAPARERMKTIECILGNHGAPDYVKMVERLSNSIGDFERMPPGWLGSPALLVQCPTLPFKSVMLGFGNIAPQLKTPKAYIGGSVPMEIDTTDQEQRDYLFYGRCYIKGKPCSVVMDTGSTTNLIAESLCNYLKLGLMDHPKPYMLGGICGTGIPVSRQAWVPFTLGDYGDTKLFDVAPTPAVDVLFGLRWMREMKVIYDGYANVYHIQKDGRTITLYPLTPLEIDQLLNDIKESRAQNES